MGFVVDDIALEHVFYMHCGFLCQLSIDSGKGKDFCLLTQSEPAVGLTRIPKALS
jgi:hypothetical protein